MESKINDMFYGAPPIIHKQARELRKRETKAEKVLWTLLSNKKVGYKFRRQHPINQFIADFYCHELKFIIEVDGEIHNSEEQQDYDRMRDEHFRKYGIDLVRLTNNEVLKNPAKVLDRIGVEIDKLKSKGK